MDSFREYVVLLVRWLVLVAIVALAAFSLAFDDGTPRCYTYDSGQVNCEYGP